MTAKHKILCCANHYTLLYSKFHEALDALYQAAKVSANFIETALTSKGSDFDKERIEVALKVLKIT